MIQLGLFVLLLLTGYVFGQLAERRHYKSILAREHKFLQLPVVTLRCVPRQQYSHAFLVTGNVVISVDYFKRILAALRNVFGGNVISYETLLDRARREAILRMKEKAHQHSAHMIYNVRLETASISKSGNRRSSVGAIEIIAYGTALVLANPNEVYS